ncbi:MAG: hypothetical protein OXE50_15000 [Chloroflexi bacterium]|nr:hypothetical protein [Chloroflexota bacterium]
MAQIQIDGIGVVEVDDSFLDLSPEEQQQVVDQIKAESQQGSATPNQAPVGGSGDISARPEAQPTPEQQKQIDGLVKRGVPEEEARESVMSQESFYQSDRQLFDPRTVPEIDEIQMAWDKLTPEQQNSFLAKSPWVASAASFLDNILPVPVLWALSDEYEAQVRNAIKENQGVANKSAAAGTVVGLVGGPAALAKILRGGVKVIRNTAAKRKSYRHAEGFREFKEKATEILTDVKSYMKTSPEYAEVLGKLANRIDEERREVMDLLEDWGRHIYEQKWNTEEIRNFLENRLNGLDGDHILYRLTDGKADLFDTFWSRQPEAFQAPGGWIEEIFTKLRHRASEISKNIGPEIAEFAAGIGGDVAANFSYSYNDWKEQGFSDVDAALLALAYVKDRTPEDITVELLDQFFGGGVGVVLTQSMIRLGTLMQDLDAETGKVRPDVYEAEGWQAESDRYAAQYNRDGQVMDPMRVKFYNQGGLSDKISKIHGEGYTAPGQAYAIAKSMGYNRGGQAMREKFYRMSSKPLPKLIR